MYGLQVFAGCWPLAAHPDCMARVPKQVQQEMQGYLQATSQPTILQSPGTSVRIVGAFMLSAVPWPC